MQEICDAGRSLKLDAALCGIRSEYDVTSHEDLSVDGVLALHYIVIAYLRFDLTVNDPVVLVAKMTFKCLTKAAALSTGRLFVHYFHVEDVPCRDCGWSIVAVVVAVAWAHCYMPVPWV